MKNCPNCGREISFEEKYTKVVVCPYCNSILEFWAGELTKVWEQWDFIEFPSIFNVWQKVVFKWKNIYVKWQLRFEYDWWFFDEFFAEIDWKTFYIREDDWQIIFTKEAKIEKSEISLIDKIPSTNFLYNWENLYIEEVGIFNLAYIKWFVNTDFSIWKDYEYLTAFFWWKKYFFTKEVKSDFLRINKEITTIQK